MNDNIVKTRLHPDGDDSTTLYPETSTDQVQGLTALIKKLGAGFMPRGEWMSAVAYEVDDVVSYNGNSYIARNAVTSATPPPSDTANWQISGGQGPQGEQGVQGERGPMPPLVDTRGNSTTDAISQQGIENIFYNPQVTLGANSAASGTDAVAIGHSATARGVEATAVGVGAYATNTNAIALGNYAVASGFGSIAIGGQVAKANNYYAISLGYGAEANETHTIAIGYKALANNEYTIALGRTATVNGTKSTAIGVSCIVNANNSILIGTEANCDTDNTFQVDKYPLLDLTTGLIPSERIQGGGGAGVPAGGTTGQYLIKKSDTDYDTEWSNPAHLYRHRANISLGQHYICVEVYSSQSEPATNLSQFKSLLANSSTTYFNASGYVQVGSPAKNYPVLYIMISDRSYAYYINADLSIEQLDISSATLNDDVLSCIV